MAYEPVMVYVDYYFEPETAFICYNEVVHACIDYTKLETAFIGYKEWCLPAWTISKCKGLKLKI